METAARLRMLLVAILSSLDLLPTGAQAPLLTLTGLLPGDQFGSSVAGTGDLDQDGVNDFVAGAPQWSIFGNVAAGYVSAISGATGAVLYTISGTGAFGKSLDATGDIDGDGVTEIVVGAPLAGTVTLLSGATGTALYTVTAASVGLLPNGRFGHAVAGAGDVNRDGFPDVVVGAPYFWAGGLQFSGIVFVLSGGNGAVLYSFAGGTASMWFGYAVCEAGDLDRDGYADVAAGTFPSCPTQPCPGFVRVFSGFNGSVIYNWTGPGHLSPSPPGNSTAYGSGLGNLGDVNVDGWDDIGVGSQTWTQQCGSLYQGHAEVRSGRDGSVLFSWFGTAPSSHLGATIRSAGDYNGDRRPDILVGLPGEVNPPPASGSSIRIHSGIDGAALVAISAPPPVSRRFGTAASALGDIDGDGLGEIAIGAIDDPLTSGAGRVYVLPGSAVASPPPPFPARAVSITSIFGPLGPPDLGISALPVMGTTQTVTLNNATPGLSGLLLISFAPPAAWLSYSPGLPSNLPLAMYPWASCVTWLPVQAGPSGSWIRSLTMPSAPYLPGYRITVQAVLGPGALPAGYEVSTALDLTLGF